MALLTEFHFMLPKKFGGGGHTVSVLSLLSKIDVFNSIYVPLEKS
jgi:hypothetical protein